MSIYRLCPSPNIGGETCFEVWDEGFTHDECDRIIEIGDSFNPEDAVVGNTAASVSQLQYQNISNIVDTIK